MSVVTENVGVNTHAKVAMVRQAKSRLEEVNVTTVDLSSVLDMLSECTRVAEAIEDVNVPFDDRKGSTLQAELGRNLNRLADMLAAASSEAKMEYWRLKGFSDPRD